MVNKKHSTALPNTHQPVRFYKFVALSFLLLTVLLLGVIVFMSTKRAEITITTRSDTVNTTFPIEIGGADGPVSGSVTTTLITLSSAVAPKGTREEAGQATAMVTLHNDSSTAQPLVATTRLLSTNNVLFRMKKSGVVPAHGTVMVEVYPDKPTDKTPVGPTKFTIPGLGTNRQLEVYGSIDSAISATVRKIGVVTQADIDDGKAALLAQMKAMAENNASSTLPGEKVLGLVVQYAVEADKEVGVDAEKIVFTGKATIAVVHFKSETAVAYANDMLRKKIIDANEILESANSEPSITFESYDATKNIATLKVVHSGLVNIDQNGKQLQKIMFFGKTDEEVRRYLLSLDHIQSVDVTFKPIWNHTVPHVADHLTVVVKQTK